MPTYEYECRKCGYHFEQFQNIMDEPLKRCPKCRCKVTRLIGTGSGIIFKGSGFYETDYRSQSYKEAAKSEKSEGALKTNKKEEKDRNRSGVQGSEFKGSKQKESEAEE